MLNLPEYRTPLLKRKKPVQPEQQDTGFSPLRIANQMLSGFISGFTALGDYAEDPRNIWESLANQTGHFSGFVGMFFPGKWFAKGASAMAGSIAKAKTAAGIKGIGAEAAGIMEVFGKARSVPMFVADVVEKKFAASNAAKVATQMLKGKPIMTQALTSGGHLATAMFTSQLHEGVSEALKSGAFGLVSGGFLDAGIGNIPGLAGTTSGNKVMKAIAGSLANAAAPVMFLENPFDQPTEQLIYDMMLGAYFGHNSLDSKSFRVSRIFKDLPDDALLGLESRKDLKDHIIQNDGEDIWNNVVAKKNELLQPRDTQGAFRWAIESVFSKFFDEEVPPLPGAKVIWEGKGPQRQYTVDHLDGDYIVATDETRIPIAEATSFTQEVGPLPKKVSTRDLKGMLNDFELLYSHSDNPLTRFFFGAARDEKGKPTTPKMSMEEFETHEQNFRATVMEIVRKRRTDPTGSYNDIKEFKDYVSDFVNTRLRAKTAEGEPIAPMTDDDFAPLMSWYRYATNSVPRQTYHYDRETKSVVADEMDTENRVVRDPDGNERPIDEIPPLYAHIPYDPEGTRTLKWGVIDRVRDINLDRKKQRSIFPLVFSKLEDGDFGSIVKNMYEKNMMIYGGMGDKDSYAVLEMPDPRLRAEMAKEIAELRRAHPELQENWDDIAQIEATKLGLPIGDVKNILYSNAYVWKKLNNDMPLEDLLYWKGENGAKKPFLRNVLEFSKRVSIMAQKYAPLNRNMLPEKFRKMKVVYIYDPDKKWDGGVHMHPEVFDALFGPTGIQNIKQLSSVKPFYHESNPDLGLLLQKMAIHRADPVMAKAMEEHGIHMMIPDNVSKQAGKAEFYNFEIGDFEREAAPTPSVVPARSGAPKEIMEVFELRDKIASASRYSGRSKDILAAQQAASKAGLAFHMVDNKPRVMKLDGTVMRRPMSEGQLKWNDPVDNPIRMSDVPESVRTRLQNIVRDYGLPHIEFMTKDQREKAWQDLQSGNDNTMRAQEMLQALIRADREGGIELPAMQNEPAQVVNFEPGADALPYDWKPERPAEATPSNLPKTRLRFMRQGKEVKPHIYDLDPERLYVSDTVRDMSADKLNKPITLALQLHTYITDPVAKHAYIEYLLSHARGTERGNAALVEFAKTGDPKVLRLNGKEGGMLAEIDRRSVASLIRTNPQLREILNKHLVNAEIEDETSEENIESIVEDDEWYDIMLPDNTGLKILEASQGRDGILNEKFARPQMLNRYAKYFFGDIARPKVKHAGNAVLSPLENTGIALTRKVDDTVFYLGNTWRNLEIPGLDANFNQKITTLGQLWNAYEPLSKKDPAKLTEFDKRLKAAYEDALEAVVARVPLDDPSGAPPLRFNGFVDVDGGSIYVSNNNMKKLGGADFDIDKAFFYFGMPKEFRKFLHTQKDNYDKHRNIDWNGQKIKFDGAESFYTDEGMSGLKNRNPFSMFSPYHLMKVNSMTTQGRGANLGRAIAFTRRLDNLIGHIDRMVDKGEYDMDMTLTPVDFTDRALLAALRAGVVNAAADASAGGMTGMRAPLDFLSQRALLISAAFKHIAVDGNTVYDRKIHGNMEFDKATGVHRWVLPKDEKIRAALEILAGRYPLAVRADGTTEPIFYAKGKEGWFSKTPSGVTYDTIRVGNKDFKRADIEPYIRGLKSIDSVPAMARYMDMNSKLFKSNRIEQRPWTSEERRNAFKRYVSLNKMEHDPLWHVAEFVQDVDVDSRMLTELYPGKGARKSMMWFNMLLRKYPEFTAMFPKRITLGYEGFENLANYVGAVYNGAKVAGKLHEIRTLHGKLALAVDENAFRQFVFDTFSRKDMRTGGREAARVKRQGFDLWSFIDRMVAESKEALKQGKVAEIYDLTMSNNKNSPHYKPTIGDLPDSFLKDLVAKKRTIVLRRAGENYEGVSRRLNDLTRGEGYKRYNYKEGTVYSSKESFPRIEELNWRYAVAAEAGGRDRLDIESPELSPEEHMYLQEQFGNRTRDNVPNSYSWKSRKRILDRVKYIDRIISMTDDLISQRFATMATARSVYDITLEMDAPPEVIKTAMTKKMDLGKKQMSMLDIVQEIHNRYAFYEQERRKSELDPSHPGSLSNLARLAVSGRAGVGRLAAEMNLDKNLMTELYDVLMISPIRGQKDDFFTMAEQSVGYRWASRKAIRRYADAYSDAFEVARNPVSTEADREKFFRKVDDIVGHDYRTVYGERDPKVFMRMLMPDVPLEQPKGEFADIANEIELILKAPNSPYKDPNTFWAVMRKELGIAQPKDLDVFKLRGMLNILRQQYYGPTIMNSFMKMTPEERKKINWRNYTIFPSTVAAEQAWWDYNFIREEVVLPDGSLSPRAIPDKLWVNPATGQMEKVYAPGITPVSTLEMLIRGQNYKNQKVESERRQAADFVIKRLGALVDSTNRTTNQKGAHDLFDLGAYRRELRGIKTDVERGIIEEARREHAIQLTEQIKNLEKELKDKLKQDYTYLDPVTGKPQIMTGNELIEHMIAGVDEVVKHNIFITPEWVKGNLVLRNDKSELPDVSSTIDRLASFMGASTTDTVIPSEGLALMRHIANIDALAKSGVSKITMTDVRTWSTPYLSEHKSLAAKYGLVGKDVNEWREWAKNATLINDGSEDSINQWKLRRIINNYLSYDYPADDYRRWMDSRIGLHSQFNDDMAFINGELQPYEYHARWLQHAYPFRQRRFMEGYFPHVNHDRKELQKRFLADQKEAQEMVERGAMSPKEYAERMEILIGRYNRMTDIPYRYVDPLERADGDSIAELLLLDDGTGSVANLDDLSARESGSIKGRLVNMPGYDTSIDALKIYHENEIRRKYNALAALTAKKQVNDFRKRMKERNEPQEVIDGWSEYMLQYVRSAMEQPSIFEDSIVEDPWMEIKKTPFYWLSDHAFMVGGTYGNKLFRKLMGADRLSFAEIKGFNLDTPEKKQKYLEKKAADLTRFAKKNGRWTKEAIHNFNIGSQMLRNFAQLEGRYEMSSLLFSPKTAVSNTVGGRLMDVVWNGLTPYFKATDMAYWQSVDNTIRTKEDLYKWVWDLGVIQDSLELEMQSKKEFQSKQGRGFAEEVLAKLRKDPTLEDERLMEIAKRHGVDREFMDIAGFFMRKTERLNRVHAFLSGHVAARQALEPLALDKNTPHLIEMGMKSIEMTQFLYDNANRSMFAGTNLGHIYSRFKLWSWASTKFQREVFNEAAKAGFKPGSPEVERLQRLMTANLFTMGMAGLLPYTMFDQLLPGILGTFQNLADWLFGEEQARERAFFGQGNIIFKGWLAPVNEVLPPISRVPAAIVGGFQQLFDPSKDILSNYLLFSTMPLGRTTRDVARAWQNPAMAVDFLTGVPLHRFDQLAKRQQKEQTTMDEEQE